MSEFRLNEEHDRALWVPYEAALETMDLHPGVRVALERADMTEMDIAKAIRDSDLASPVRFGNVLLIALRITGTGASYRKNANEYVWRDPSLYMNREFVERCNGLPVILEHPGTGEKNGEKKQFLDSKEFKDRIVGMVMLPYLVPEDNEVWGIARIYDDETARILCTRDVSTSPCVVFKTGEEGVKLPMEDGNHLLIEDKPGLLDHLAICELGVWDTDGVPAGVDNESARSDSFTQPLRI